MNGPEHGYHELIMAIMHRAVQDALGHCGPTRGMACAEIQQEAQAWLADEGAVRDLLELAGLDAAPVLRRLRPLRETGR